jgi:anti-sigma28 factor (negative regulator of flagellin synthesis)
MTPVDTFYDDRPLTAGIGDGVANCSHHARSAKLESFSMSQINPISQPTPVQKIVANPIQKVIPPDAQPVRASDRLELSGASNLLAALKSNDVRTDKVASIRQQLQDGTYDPDGKKLDAAADKLLDELTQD